MTTRWVWGTGWATATLAGQQRASGLDRCTYSGGAPPQGGGRPGEAGGGGGARRHGGYLIAGG